MTRRIAPIVRTFLVVVLTSAPAWAFGYLEHTWATDRACAEALIRLAPAVAADERLAPRYLALALVCPERATPNARP